jgi:uncharacterized protein YyaL (SSP411 family)
MSLRAIGDSRGVADFDESSCSCPAHLLDKAKVLSVRSTRYLSRPQEVALVWPDDANQALALLRPVPAHLLLAGGREGDGGGGTPLLAGRPALQGAATAYLCERFLCQAPTTDPDELAAQLEAAQI